MACPRSEFRGRYGRDAAKRTSAAMLVGHAAPDPARFHDACHSTSLRHDRRDGQCAGRLVAAASARRELRRLGAETSADPSLSAETQARMAPSPSTARWHRLPTLARPCARVQGWDAIAGCDNLE